MASRNFHRRSFLKRSAAAGAAALLAPAVHASGAPTPQKIKIALVGTAHGHGHGKLIAARQMADVFDVVGVVEPDEKLRRAVEARREFSGLPFLSEEQLYNLPGLQAVMVETAVREMTPAALRAAQAGVHIHLEKPGGSSLPALRKVFEIAKQKDRVIQLGYMFRGNPAFEFCFRGAKEGLFGNLFEVHGVIGKVLPPPERKEQAEFSGGTMFELGCHLIDAMLILLGKPQKVHSYLRRTRPDLDTLADNTLAVFEFARATATIRSAVIDVEGGARRQFIVCGDRGAATILPLEPPKLNLTLAQAAGEYRKGIQPIPLRAMNGRYGDQLIQFARILRGEAQLDYKPEHDLTVFEAVLQASDMPTH